MNGEQKVSFHTSISKLKSILVCTVTVNCSKGNYTYFTLLNVYTTIFPLMQSPLFIGLLNYVKGLEILTKYSADTPTYCFTHAQAACKVIKNVVCVCY